MVLSVHNLSISYPINFTTKTRKTIISDLSFELQPGEIYGFLGLNGVGKTTTLETIMGFIQADSGEIIFFGESPLNNTIRQKIGYAPDHTPYFEEMTGREHITQLIHYMGLEKQKSERFGHDLFASLGLTYAQDRLVSTYSKGMKQRLGLIMSLINNPDLIIRDEPMSGLDPLGRTLVKTVMKDLQKQGKTILFSTHILSDVEEIADRFGIVHEGRLLYQTTTKTLNEPLEDFFCKTLLNLGSTLELQ